MENKSSKGGIALNLERKLSVIPDQERAFIEGTITNIGNELLFVDDINEEAYDLEDLSIELEIHLNGRWKKGTIIDDTILYIDNNIHYLKDGDYVRFRKSLPYALEQLIEELSDEAYLQFVKTLNSLSYSLYDCIYCHNFLSFLESRFIKEGMNVMIFDNEEQLCVVQHFFDRRSENKQDRFEYTQSDGKRLVTTSFHC